MNQDITKEYPILNLFTIILIITLWMLSWSGLLIYDSRLIFKNSIRSDSMGYSPCYETDAELCSNCGSDIGPFYFMKCCCEILCIDCKDKHDRDYGFEGSP